MNLINDVINVNKHALKKSMAKIVFVPILAILLILMNVGESLILNILSVGRGSTGFILGFVRYAVRVVFMSAIINILSDIVIYDRFRTENMIYGYKTWFSQVSSAYFYIVLAEWLFIFVGNQGVINIIVYFALLIIMSVFYESIYIGNSYGGNVFYDIFNFLKNNTAQWIIILLLFLELQYRFDVLMRYFSFELLLNTPLYTINLIVVSLLLAFSFIFKGNLFYTLNGSSMRKREFQGSFR